jgi:hypothetical protein
MRVYSVYACICMYYSVCSLLPRARAMPQAMYMYILHVYTSMHAFNVLHVYVCIFEGYIWKYTDIYMQTHAIHACMSIHKSIHCPFVLDKYIQMHCPLV